MLNLYLIYLMKFSFIKKKTEFDAIFTIFYILKGIETSRTYLPDDFSFNNIVFM